MDAALSAVKSVCFEVCGRLGKCVTVVAQLLHLEETGAGDTGDRGAGSGGGSTPDMQSPAGGSSHTITRDVLQQLYSFGFEVNNIAFGLLFQSSCFIPLWVEVTCIVLVLFLSWLSRKVYLCSNTCE